MNSQKNCLAIRVILPSSVGVNNLAALIEALSLVVKGDGDVELDCANVN